MGFLKNFRILFQVSLISAIALAGFITIGLIYFVSSSNQSEVLSAGEYSQDGKDIVDEISYDFLNARRAEKDFIVRLNNKYAKKHAVIVAGVFPKIEKLREYNFGADTQNQIDDISLKFGKYVKQFNKVVKGWHEFGLTSKDGLRGSLRKSVHDVEKKLKEFDEPRLMVTMLMMRRHEKDFFMRVVDKYVGRMDKRLAEFVAQISTSNIPPVAQDDILKLMSAYHSDFKAAAKIRLQLVPDTSALSKIFKEATPALDAIHENAVENLAVAKSEARSIVNTTKTLMILAVLIVASIVTVLSTIIGKTLAGSISNMTKAMQTLAGGNSSVKIPAQNRKNEIGDMAHATNIFKENMIENERMSEEQRIAREKRENRATKLEKLTSSFGENVSRVLSNVTESAAGMEVTARTMTATAEQTANQAQIVATAAEEATNNVQTVASASEELSSSIQEISRQVSQSTNIANTAVAEVSNTNQKVNGLAKAANKIGEVVEMITDIADQTNLLALNATIEAARAGEAGKGFAVVASEVKNLANQTAKATEEISTQISNVQGATQDAVVAIGNIGNTINQLNEISSAIAAAVEEQGAATQEIARNVEQAASGTTEVSATILEVTEATKLTDSSSNEVLVAASGMSSEADSLKKQVETFLSEIKSI